MSIFTRPNYCKYENCGKILRKGNKSGYCTNCLLKTRYKRNKEKKKNE